MDYKDWDGSELVKELRRVRGHNVEPRTQSIFYSGPIDKHGVLGIRNSERALRYSQREGLSLIQQTDRGAYLKEYQRVIDRLSENVGEFSPRFVRQYEWGVTSRSFAELARGHVKAFVAGAGTDDIYRQMELETLITNKRVKSINGIKRTTLVKLFENGQDREKNLDLIYHMVARAGARQDLRQALRTGDRELIRDALVQMQLCQNQRRLDSGKALDESPEAETKLNTKLDRRADYIASIRQNSLRREALQEIKSYADTRIREGTFDARQAERLMLGAEKAIQEQHGAFRMKTLAQIQKKRKLALNNQAAVGPLHAYLNAKAQYENDLRAIRQFNGTRFMESTPIEREINRHVVHQNISGKPHPVSRKRQRRKMKSNAAGRVRAQRPRPPALSHGTRLSHH